MMLLKGDFAQRDSGLRSHEAIYELRLAMPQTQSWRPTRANLGIVKWSRVAAVVRSSAIFTLLCSLK